MQPLLKALAWSFVHSLWQGLLAALVAAIIISATKKTKASLRYNLLGMVLVLFLVAVSVTFIVHLREMSSSSLAVASEGYGAGNLVAGNAAITIPGGFMADLTAWFNNNTGLLLLLWTLFFLVNCLKLVSGLAAVNRLRHYKVYPVTEEWKIKFEQLRDALGIRQSICLLQSELVKVPVALGFLKPVILLPVGFLTRISPEQVEAILLHELGHIRRKDYLVNFVQHFAEAIFFFNPGLLWISSLLRQEREACCDDIVVAKTGQKRNYLNALVSFQEYSLSHTSYAMGISSRKQYLLNRVKRIVTNENKKLNLFEKAALLAGILLFSAFTYVTNQKETVGASFPIAAEQFTTVQAPTVLFSNKTPGVPATQLTTSDKKAASRSDRYLIDTVPVKKDKIAQPVSDTSHNKLPTSKDWETARILQEIQQIKDQIGIKKESIGVKKEQLALAKNSREEKDLKEQIEKERDEVEEQRDVLEEKREQLDNLKKMKEKQPEIKNEQKNGMKHDDKNEKKNEEKNRVDKKRVDIERNDIKRNNKTADTKKPFKNNTTLFKKDSTQLFQKDKTTTAIDVKKVEVKLKNDVKLEYKPGQKKPGYQPGQQGKLEYKPGLQGKLEFKPIPPIKLQPPPSPGIKKKPQSPSPARQVKI